MHIQERFDILRKDYEDKDILKYLEIAEKATPHLSLLGTRYITVEGYTDTLNLDDLAYLFAEKIRYIKGVSSLRDKNRIHSKITNIYTRYEKILGDASAITYYLATISEVVIGVIRRIRSEAYAPSYEESIWKHVQPIRYYWNNAHYEKDIAFFSQD